MASWKQVGRVGTSGGAGGPKGEGDISRLCARCKLSSRAVVPCSWGGVWLGLVGGG